MKPSMNAIASLSGNFSGTTEKAPVVRLYGQQQQQQYSNCPVEQKLREEKARQQQMQQPQL